MTINRRDITDWVKASIDTPERKERCKNRHYWEEGCWPNICDIAKNRALKYMDKSGPKPYGIFSVEKVDGRYWFVERQPYG